MSKENLEQFMNQIAESEELQAKIGEEIEAKALIALGAECGCEFTAEELQESAELSDEELDGVAGGRRTWKERRADRKAIKEITKTTGDRQMAKDLYYLFKNEGGVLLRSDSLDDGDWNPDQPTLTP